MMLSNNAEELTVNLLTGQGWQILKRNLRHIGFELDIVAFKAATLVIVEVKYRKTADGLFDYQSLLTKKKIDALVRGADYFIQNYEVPNYNTIRFDLAVVSGNQDNLSAIKYFPNVIQNLSL